MIKTLNKARRSNTLYVKLLAAERRKHAKHGNAPADAAQALDEYAADGAIWVREALEKLDPSEREILMLREYEQLSYA